MISFSLSRSLKNRYASVGVLVLLISVVFYQFGDIHRLFSLISLFFLFLSSGLTLAIFFKKILPFNDVIGLLTNSALFTIIILQPILLVWGQIGGNYSQEGLLGFYIITTIFNIIFMILKPPVDSERLPIVRDLDFNSIIWIALFSITMIMISIISLENLIPNWDAFNFWAVDAKYIYEFQKLRDHTFDIIRAQQYSSFLTLMYAQGYYFMGGVYEQFVSFFTLFFASLSFLLISNATRSSDNKVWGSIINLLVLLATWGFMRIQSIMISLYSDVFCSLLILIYSIILFQKPPTHKELWKRSFLLILISFCLFLVKFPYAILTVSLIALMALSDLKLLLRSRSLYRNRSVLIMFFILILFIFSNLSFLEQFKTSESVLSVLSSTKHSYYSYLVYVNELITYLTTKVPQLIPLAVITIFLSLLHIQRIKTLMSVLGLLLITLGIPIGLYIYNQQSLNSSSILRYTTLSYFLFPVVLLQFKDVQIPRISKWLMNTFTFTIGLYLLFTLFIEYRFDFKFTPHNGYYSESGGQYIYDKAANIVEESTKEGDKVMIMSGSQEKITNMNLPSIYVRYYLFDQSVGGQYSINSLMIYEFTESFDADYILFTNYSGSIPNCDITFDPSRYYLSKVDRNASEEDCLIIDEHTTDITDRL